MILALLFLFFWFMTAMFTALALFSRMAAAASSSSSFMVAVRFWVKGQLQPTLAKMCRLAAVSSNNASVTFADLAAACVQNATGRNYDSFIVTEFVTSSVLDLSSSSSVSFDRDSLMLPVELTCHSFTPPHSVVLFKVRRIDHL